MAFSYCLASDLSRAWETAKICLAGRNMEPQLEPDLREQDVGEMEGLTWDEMEAQFPEALRAYLSDWWGMCPPGGESPEATACADGAAGFDVRPGGCAVRGIGRATG